MRDWGSESNRFAHCGRPFERRRRKFQQCPGHWPRFTLLRVPYNRYMKPFAIATTAAMLTACATQSVPPIQSSLPTHDAVFPPVCTAPRIKSGDQVTSISAFGDLSRRLFVLRQPSTWTKVEWLKVLPPAATQVHPRSTPRAYVEYWGTYTLSDKTQGCLYVVAPRRGGDATVTGAPRIPTKGATLPVDFGTVLALTFKLKNDQTGSGTVTLVHTNGSPAMTGTLTILGATTPSDSR